jgi:uncharacterized protein (DUF1330 family)
MTAYIIAEFEIINPEIAQQYVAYASKSVLEAGGRYVALAQPRIPLEGEWDENKQWLMIEFDSIDKANAWYESAEYAKALEISQQAMTRRMAVAVPQETQ